MEKYWPKRSSYRQLQEAQKKTLIGPELLQWRQSVSLHIWRCQGPCQPSSCATLTFNSHWSTAATGKKKSCICACRVALVVSDSLRPCRLWPARLLCQGGGCSWQEYWSVLANIGCHTLLRSDQISRSVVSDSLRPHESQHARLPCPSPTPGGHSDSRPSSQ